MRSTHRWRDDDPGDEDDAEPMPLIELTDDLDDEGTVDQLTEDESEPRSRRRSLSLPRRYLAAGAAGLLAIGFAGGMVVQRASSPPPDDTAVTANTTELGVRASNFDVPSEDSSTCRYGYGDGYGSAGLTTVCTGTLYSIRHAEDGWQLTLGLDHGVTIGIEVDDSTSVDGLSSVGELAVGTTLVVSGHPGKDGAMHATAITFG
ncbi:hypothetical protein AB0I55_32045 [Actinocatenispora sera]|jgi:hypothetical protein|uniref:DUF5666 domain-containing protein n=1 Tax=Actinocatenispora sera TaxID=390989 RepID=A0A810KWB9_9ACTN|nr:hypothetical protein [Actinocatenispora sera]BCJ27520.1 hypothetical protein Asera_16280 [Actinocatenispora sera]